MKLTNLSICASLLLAAGTLNAQTWTGGTGNWNSDNWGLSGGWIGDGTNNQRAFITGASDVVTVGSGVTINSTGQFTLENGTVNIENGGSLTFSGNFRDSEGGTINVRDNSILSLGGTQSPDAQTTFNIGPDAGDNPNVTFASMASYTVVQDGGTVTNNNKFVASTLTLNGGIFNKTTNGDFEGATNTITVAGGTLNSATMRIDQQNADQDWLLNVNSGAVNITGDVTMDYRAGNATQDRVITIQGGAFDLSGDLRFAESDNNVSNKDFVVVGSGASSISLGGLDVSSTVINDAEFIFTPDAGGVTSVEFDTTTPDFSSFDLTLNNFSSAWSAGTDIELFDIVGGVSATAFSNLAEGASVTLNDGSQDHEFNLTYTGGDGNDIYLVVIPEPGTLSLVAGAIVACAICLRRRRT